MVSRNILSSWAKDLPHSGIREVFHEALKLHDVIHLEIGDPDFNTPTEIIKEAYRAMIEGYTHYTHNAGLLELREAVAEYYSKKYGVHLDPEKHIAITLGGTEGLFLSLLAVLDPGDDVLIPDPGYPSYVPMIRAARGNPLRYGLKEEEFFRLNVDEIMKRLTPKTKVMIVNNPHNPTGSITPLDVLNRLSREACDRNIVIIADEVYENIVFDGKTFNSMAQISECEDNIIVVNSLSKTFAMTGLRIGFVVSKNEKVINAIVKFQEGVAACAPAPFQKAAAIALRSYTDIMRCMVKEYEERRNKLLELLKEIPEISYIKPEGTFYLFLNISRYTSDSKNFAFELLHKKRVAVAPGAAFGPRGEGYIRISFAVSVPTLIEGMKRIAEYLAYLRG